MKILLYNPPMPYAKKGHKQTPLGLCYLSSCVKNKAECVVYDGNVETGFSDYIKRFNPDIIGISILTATFNIVARIVKDIKQILPDTFLLAGGIHASVFPKETLETGFDLVIRGEGERTFQEVVDLFCLRGLDEIYSKNLFHNIDGLSYFLEGKLVHTKDRLGISDLDSIPFPDRSNLPLNQYEHDSILTSRGCAFNCFYCSSSYYWGQKIRYRSAQNVMEEIYQILFYGMDKIYFCDDNFTSNHRLVREICNLIIQSGIKIRWSALSRVDTINPEIIELMKLAGCEVLSLGIENGTDSFMESIKKTNYNKTIRAFDIMHQAGIKTRTTWIVGLGKTYQEEKNSFELMKEILPDQVSVHCLIPFPNTDAWIHPERHNLIFDKEHMDWDVMNMTYSPQLLDYIHFTHISKAQIIELLFSVKEEMKRYGYDGEQRVFETFIDENIVPVL